MVWGALIVTWGSPYLVATTTPLGDESMAFLSELPVGSIGSSALVTLFVIALLRGYLVPRSTLQDVRNDRDARIAEITHEKDIREAQLIQERDAWKQAFLNADKSREILIDQNGELTELARTGTAVLQSLPSARQIATADQREDNDGGVSQGPSRR